VPAHRPFLTAVWRNLAMLNFRVDPQQLLPWVRRGLQLDLYEGEAVVTLVGFQFEQARLFGIRVPWHQQFAEVNLRFYVRRRVDGEERLGVVFIKEMVPRRMVAWTARYVFGENFARVPVRCGRQPTNDGSQSIEYAWGRGAATGNMYVSTGIARPAELPSELARFVVERSWAYTIGRGDGWREYHVTHRPWRVWPALSAELIGNPSAWYGPQFGAALQSPPLSALLVDGSEVDVFRV
jgi:uncharacterized protein YqjF (DUF2071 family)